MANRNARFWVWHKGELVKITLSPGQEISIRCGGEHEEGYSSNYTTYRHEGPHIGMETDSYGRDCDGRYEYHSRQICYHKKLKTIKPRNCYSEHEGFELLFAKREKELMGILLPYWCEESRSQRDYSAEQAGY